MKEDAVDSNVFLYSGKEEGSARTAGVGIMLTKTAYSSLMSWEPISERFITARFRSRVRNISIIQCYAPTEQAFNTEKDNFYNLLSTIYDKTSHVDIVMVMGDLKAKVGQDNYTLNHVMGIHGIGARNDNGERFVDFCSTNYLVIRGIIFQHKRCHKVSWISPSGRTSNQNDHFAISRRFRGCLMNVRNKRGANIGNSLDHFVMVATLCL